jgi:hypothetical protein
MQATHQVAPVMSAQQINNRTLTTHTLSEDGWYLNSERLPKRMLQLIFKLAFLKKKLTNMPTGFRLNKCARTFK